MTNLESSSPKLELLPSPRISRGLAIAFLVISFLGFLDATYLAVEHYRGVIPPCGILKGCEEVTTSAYSQVFGIPVALGGSIFYLLIFILSVLRFERENDKFLRFAAYLTPLGLLASLWFLYLQLFVIKAICIYCVFSVLTSATLFILSLILIKKYKKTSDG